MEKVQSTISQRIMSIIDEKGMSQSQLSKLNGTINKHLHRLQAGLTTYWARHSWATIAASSAAPLHPYTSTSTRQKSTAPTVR